MLHNGAAVLGNAKKEKRELAQAGTDLGRSGNNINQLEYHANNLTLDNKFTDGISVTFNEHFKRFLGNRS